MQSGRGGVDEVYCPSSTRRPPVAPSAAWGRPWWSCWSRPRKLYDFGFQLMRGALAAAAIRSYWDIGYSFLVGEDGNVYEGRGWTAEGAHTIPYNSVGIGICVIGDFSRRTPNQAALQAVQQLIQCGVSQGRIRSDYRLLGHRDVTRTICPGNGLYNEIEQWSNFG